MNKRLAELFKQKYRLERERDKEVAKTFKDFLWGVVGFCLCNVVFLLTTKIFQRPEEFARKVNVNSDLLWTTAGLCFLIIFIIFFCHQKILRYQKKINKIELQIIEELSKF